MRESFIGAEGGTTVQPLGPEVALVGVLFLVCTVFFTYYDVKHPHLQRALFKNRFTRHFTLDPDAPRGIAYFAGPTLIVILSIAMIIAGLSAL